MGLLADYLVSQQGAGSGSPGLYNIPNFGFANAPSPNTSFSPPSFGQLLQRGLENRFIQGGGFQPTFTGMPMVNQGMGGGMTGQGLRGGLVSSMKGGDFGEGFKSNIQPKSIIGRLAAAYFGFGK